MSIRLCDLLLNDRGFAFDPASGETYQLSATGLRLVRLLEQGASNEEALARILEEYEVDENTARRDVEGFLRSMELAGWKS